MSDDSEGLLVVLRVQEERRPLELRWRYQVKILASNWEESQRGEDIPRGHGTGIIVTYINP